MKSLALSHVKKELISKVSETPITVDDGHRNGLQNIEY
jgi:hypothetical protein